MTARRRFSTIASLLGVAILLGGCSTSSNVMPTTTSTLPFVLTAVTGVEQIGQVTGADSPGKTEQYAVNGTDLGSMFEFDGKTWFVFGDTFGEREEGFTGGGGSLWRSNTLGYTTDTDPSNGITLDGMILDENGQAAELLPSNKVDNDEMTVIPTHGFAVGDAMYLHWMSVRHWGTPGEWEVNDAGLAKSTDSGQSWVVLESPRWGGESNFVQVAPAHVQENGVDWLYFWGITHGRFGGVALAKVEAATVEDESSWLYFTHTDPSGKPQWSSNPVDASIILDDTVGELSVVHNPYLDRWIMTYLSEGTGVVIREGLSQWGPWGDAIPLVAMSDVPGPYAPFMSPRFTADGGKTIFFALSIWDPYNVFWYRAELSQS